MNAPAVLLTMMCATALPSALATSDETSATGKNPGSPNGVTWIPETTARCRRGTSGHSRPCRPSSGDSLPIWSVPVSLTRPAIVLRTPEPVSPFGPCGPVAPVAPVSPFGPWAGNALRARVALGAGVALRARGALDSLRPGHARLALLIPVERRLCGLAVRDSGVDDPDAASALRVTGVNHAAGARDRREGGGAGDSGDDDHCEGHELLREIHRWCSFRFEFPCGLDKTARPGPGNGRCAAALRCDGYPPFRRAHRALPRLPAWRQRSLSAGSCSRRVVETANGSRCGRRTPARSWPGGEGGRWRPRGRSTPPSRDARAAAGARARGDPRRSPAGSASARRGRAARSASRPASR